MMKRREAGMADEPTFINLAGWGLPLSGLITHMTKGRERS